MDNTQAYQRVLNSLGYQDKYHYLEDAFSRNIGIFTLPEQDRLMNSTIAIPGMGGVGGQHLITLARAGVCNFHLSDFDRFEPVNINRQYGAKIPNFGQLKQDQMIDEALSINPYLNIKQFGAIDKENVDKFLEGVDVVADGMDFFNFDIRRLIFRKAHRKGAYVVTAGPLGFSSALLVFAPDRGMTFDEYFNIKDTNTLEDNLISFFIGLAPRATQRNYIDPGSINLQTFKGPSTGIGCIMSTAAAATEIVRILLGKKGVKPVPNYFQYDPFVKKFHKGYMPFGNRNPVQKIKFRIVKKQFGSMRAKPAEEDAISPKWLPDENGIPKEVLGYILRAGIKAPSGDNCQPWEFKVSGTNTIHLFLDRGADTSFFNVNQLASYIACGAAIENISLAASRFGLQAGVEYTLHPGQRGEQVAVIKLDKTGVIEDPLQRFIWERHTNRTHYNGKAFEPHHMAPLLRCNETNEVAPGALLTLIDDRYRIREIADIVYKADTIRIEHRGLHEHFVKMIRFTDEAKHKTRDGLPLKNLEAGLSGELFLKATRSWRVMELMNKTGISNAVPEVSRKGIKEASCIGFVSTPDRSVESFVRGGRFLQQIWLTATRMGLSFQPMTAITLFRVRCQLGGESDFSPNHRQILSRLWEDYNELFGIDETSGRGDLMLFRVGYGLPVSCRTLRKKTKAFIL